MRADLNMYPRGMEDWDYGHLTFVATVRLTIEREIEFVQKHGLIEQDLINYQNRYLTRDGGISPDKILDSKNGSYIGLTDDNAEHISRHVKSGSNQISFDSSANRSNVDPEMINLEKMILDKQNRMRQKSTFGKLKSAVSNSISSSNVSIRSNEKSSKKSTTWSRVPLSNDFSVSHLDSPKDVNNIGNDEDDAL